MKRLAHIFGAALLGALASLAVAATFTKFTPATGILVGTATSSTTTAATSTNVIALWSGTCNSSSFLRGDGSCASAGGGTGTTGTFTLNWSDACTTTPTTTVAYTLDDTNTVVTWWMPPMSVASCTSDSTSFTSGTDVPASLRPTSADVLTGLVVRTIDNGTGDNVMGCVLITTTGVALIRRSTATGCSGSWTNSGAKAVNQSTGTAFSYRLN